MSDVMGVTPLTTRAELLERYKRLSETIKLIDRNLGSDSIYPPDITEIKANREKFATERDELAGELGKSL